MAGLRVILAHGAITLLAVSIAFSLPYVARYILFGWWPMVEADPNLMLVSEIALASALVLAFNLAKIAWDGRYSVAMARTAALVHARNAANDWRARWREHQLLKRLPAVRDAVILSVTGHETLVNGNRRLRSRLEDAYELRVMLVNPGCDALKRRAESMPVGVTVLALQAEIEASVAFLARLRKRGKKVALKFCDRLPFWKVIVLGDHAWVQHCHFGIDATQQPEFVFALQPANPRDGLFIPFYVYALERWNESEHPEYDFDRMELVHRDASGNEIGRAPLGAPGNGVAQVAESAPPA